MRRGKTRTLAVYQNDRHRGAHKRETGGNLRRGDAASARAMIAARKSKDGTKTSYVVECVGVRPKNATTEEVLRWRNTRISVGDEVSFKFVEAVSAAAPFDSQDVPRNDGQDS